MSYKTTEQLIKEAKATNVVSHMSEVYCLVERLEQLEERHKLLMHWLALYQFEGEAGNPGDRIICDYNCWHQELYQQIQRYQNMSKHLQGLG